MNLRARSLRRTLLLGILLPVIGFLMLNTAVLYRQALAAADTAYDRTLLATAKSLGEQLRIEGNGPAAHVQASLPYSALEAFEADNRSRIFYRVTGFKNEMVSGFDDLPAPKTALPDQKIYAALVHFYDDQYRGMPVRMALLLQPVASSTAQGMTTIQVAETLELRQTLARQILVDTLWRQAGLVLVIATVVVFVVQRATRPVRALSHTLAARSDNDLSPLRVGNMPRELLPLVEATNQHMQRLSQLLEHQKRFVRDTSHQLRTPLAVLKTQVQSAQRGDLPPDQALEEISHTVDSATELANQMLALAKVEQLREERDLPQIDWSAVIRQVALDLAPLIAHKGLDFSLDLPTKPTPVRSHEWAVRELGRNLLHNAIAHSPNDAALSVSLVVGDQNAALTVSDSGSGISPALRDRLFQPFATEPRSGLGGTGLGLTICHGIVQSLGGSIELINRESHGKVLGLGATVRLPLASPTLPA